MNARHWTVAVMGTIGALFFLCSFPGIVAEGSKAFAGESSIAGTGALTGKVTAPREFKAAQVYAKNTDKKMVYMVYTSGGKYQAINLLPGNYELSVQKNGFASDVQKVSITAGATVEADFTLREAPMVPPRGVYPSFRIPLERPAVSYDELYPPAPGP